MTPLRQRMRADLQRRGLSARTPALSVRAVRQRAAPDHTSPDRRTADARRDDWRSRTPVTPASRRARTIALCGLTCVDAHTVPQAWTTRPWVRPPRQQTRPVSLRLTAVRTRLAQLNRPRDRGCRTTLDAGGRRLPEGPHRPVTALDAARRRLHVRPGQGATDRSGPRPPRPWPRRRASWVTPRHPVWLVPAPGRAGTGLATATPPLPRARGPEACRAALTARGLPQRASGHPRRHAWATPRLDAGGPLRRLQASRRPSSPATTAVSTPLTRTAPERAAASLHRRMAERAWSRVRRSSAATARRPAPRAGTSCRTALAGRWRPAHPAVPTRVAARSTPLTPATTTRLATSPARTAPGPQARRVPPRPGSRGTRLGAGRSRLSWAPAPGPSRCGTCAAARRRASTPSWAVPQPRPATPAPGLPGVAAARSGGSGSCPPGLAPGPRSPLGTRWGPPVAWRPMAVSGSPPGHMAWCRSRRVPAGGVPTCARPGARPPCVTVAPTPSGTRPGWGLVHRSAVERRPYPLWRPPACGWRSATTASARASRARSPAPPQPPRRGPSRSAPSRPRPASAGACPTAGLTTWSRSGRPAWVALAPATT
jgi:hypothetical protein